MSAFTAIVFADGFDNVTVRRIIEDANVARSTFYEYFSSKDDVLRACMSQFLSVIADTVANDTCPPNLVPVLEHLWEKRRLTDAIFTGSARSILGLRERELAQG